MKLKPKLFTEYWYHTFVDCFLAHIMLTLVCLCATPQEGCNHEESSACQRATQVS